MKKHIIAAAVAAAVAVPAMAQNVSLYGRLDAGYGSLDISSGTTATPTVQVAGFGATPGTTAGIGVSAGKGSGIGYGLDQTAIWGMRGTEDLGGGMRASFVIESGIAGANTTLPNAITTSSSQSGATGMTFSNATNIGSRLLYASVSSGNTEGRIGFQSSFARDVAVGYSADAATNNTGNYVNLGFSGLRHNAATVLHTVGAVTVGAALSSQSSNTNVAGVNDTDTGKGYSLMARYTQGPLSAAIAYMKNENGLNGINERSAMIAGASYNFGTAQAFAQYGTLKNNTTTNTVQPEAKLWNVGVRVPVGNLGLFASISGGDNRDSTSAVYKGDVSGYNVGARYNLSKRTNVYAIYGALDVDTTTTATTEVRQFGMGVTHNF